MSEAKIPIIPLGEDYLVSLQGDIGDEQLASLKERLFQKLSKNAIRGTIVDVSGLATLDSFMARLMNELAQGCRINGTEIFLVGIQPEVAMTLVEMGLSIPEVKAEQTVQAAIDALDRAERD